MSAEIVYPYRSEKEKSFRHTRSVADKVFEVWRSPNRFTKNPDIIQLPSGRILLIYCDDDQHWSIETQILTLLASDDLGQTWYKFKEIGTRDWRKGEERYVTPRLSLLDDGRLVVLIDQDDFTHFHYDQPPGILAFWSEDDGETWTGEVETGIMGFEPDRMMDLPDGRLTVCSHIMRPETQEYAEIMSCSDDGGKTWYEYSTIAHDGYHFFCEGALVVLDGGKELACVMRENHSGGIPSFVAFSRDTGKTWSDPQPVPFAVHRPYAKQLADGRVFVAGRHVNGVLGTHGWVGDLRAEAGKHVIGGPRQHYRADLSSDALIIENGADLECRYSLLPPESSFSTLEFEAEVKVEGPDDEAVAFMSVSVMQSGRGPVVLYLAPNWMALSTIHPGTLKPVDLRDYRTIKIQHNRGLMEVLVDGELMLSSPVKRIPFFVADGRGGDVTKRTQFGQFGEQGRSHWKRVSYRVENPTLENHEWEWSSASGEWPDQYQRDRIIQIHPNPPNQPHDPNHSPDHGYPSWLVLEDGRILFLDYTNYGDPQGKSHLVGVYLEPEDLK